MFDPRTVNEQLAATLAVLEFKKKETEALSYDLAVVQAKAVEDLKKLDETWRREFDGWCAGRPACGLEPKKADAEQK
jgi:hypothetical protein